MKQGRTLFWKFNWCEYRLSYDCLRGGVVPYGYDPLSNEYYYLLAIDEKSGQYTDFGGGIKKYEIPYLGALRELSEESIMLYSDLVINPIDVVVFNESVFTIFVYDRRVRIDPNFRDDIVKEFDNRRSTLYNNPIYPRTWFENSSIRWITYDELVDLDPTCVYDPFYELTRIYVS